MCIVPSPTLFWCFITTSFNVTSNSLTIRFSRTKAMSGSFSWYIVHCVTENKCSNSIHWADEWKNEWAQWPTRISPEILSHPPYVLSSSQTAIMGDSLPESLTLSPSPEWLGNPPPHLALFSCLSQPQASHPYSSWPSGQHSCASWRQSSDTNDITYPLPHQLWLLPGIPHTAPSSSYWSAFSGPRQNGFPFN